MLYNLNHAAGASSIAICECVALEWLVTTTVRASAGFGRAYLGRRRARRGGYIIIQVLGS